MPLIKRASKKAMSENIRREMHAGKPQKQAIAIAYSIQRKARHKKAAGGSVESGSRDMNMADGGKIKTIEEKRAIHPKQKGVHEADIGEKRGPSYAAQMLKSKQPYGNRAAKEEHQQNLNDLRSMPKPKLQGLAEGGAISAKTEKRPMPDDLHDDEMQAHQNKHMRDNGQDGWTDKPTERQAIANDVRGKKLPIKRPRMVPSDAFSTRLYDAEGNLEESAKPGPYGEQPSKWHDEEEAKASGHPVRDMEDEHSTHRKPYAKGGAVDAKYKKLYENYTPQQHKYKAEELEQSLVPGLHPEKRKNREERIAYHDSHVKEAYAKGGEVEESDYEHPENPYEDSHLSELTPSHDEGAEMARHEDEEDQDREGPEHHEEEPHIDHNLQMDMVHDDEVDGEEPAVGHHMRDDEEEQPMDEEEEEHHNSIASAVMARMKKMAEGGEILRHKDEDDIKSHDSIYSDDSDTADLSRNADEDANEEDQSSWNALRKENYSESEGLRKLSNPQDSDEHGDEEEMDSHDEHDMISSIRRKMKSRKQF